MKQEKRFLRRLGKPSVVVALTVVATCPLDVAASLTDVTDSQTVSVSATGDGVRAVSVKSHGIPADIPTPIFWFDCTNTNGWEIALAADGSNRVARIPSLVGDGRFLTTNVTLEGSTFTGWGNTKPKAPALAFFDDLPGGPALDFGRFGSRTGMMFNPHSYGEGSATTNVLSGIGAMVAVWGSHEGGGYLFGGGNGQGGQEDYRWARGWDNQTGDNSGTVKYWTAVLGSYRSTIATAPGFYMHDGIPASAELIGMNGGWEVLGFSADSAKWSATGLGLGDLRSGMSRDGGCRIAEMLVFGETLTQDQMKRLQLYLREKWLNKGIRGYNGDANLGTMRLMPASSPRGVVDTPEGETLSLQKLAGGRASTAAVKTGDGTLRLNGASDFTAPVVLNGGTLELSRKTAPVSAEELPYGLYMRFDASQRDSMDLEDDGGTNFVSRMRNLAGGKWKNKPIAIRTYRMTYGDLRPWLTASPLGENLPLVDFGPRLAGAKGRYFIFTYDNNGTDTRFAPNTCGTLVALLCAERGGGHVCNGPFKRADRWPGEDAYSSVGLLNPTAFGNASIANNTSESRIFINGIRLAPTAGFSHPGCQVVAYQVQPGSFDAIAAEQYYTDQETSASGGVMFGEMLFWNRPLSDEELLDAQAYLSRKWLGKDIPGYSGVSSGVADVQTLEVQESSAIDVAADSTVKIASVSAKCEFEKRGEGTLLVGEGSDLSGLSVKGGVVRIAGKAPDVTAQCQLAAGAAFHLDASASNSFILVERDGTNFVKSWYSPNGIPARQTAANVQPWLNTNETDRLNGMPVVDFGTYKGEGCVNQKWMPFAAQFDSVRAAFIVRGSQEGGGMLLGENRSDLDDWGRHGSMAGTLSIPIAALASASVKNGEFYLDGVKTNCTQALPTGGYELIDVHPAAGTHVSALACYKGTYMRGGMRLAEVILYERPLSEREKIATRNYLTRKWFPERALQELPEENVVDATVSMRQITLDGTVAMDVDDPISAATVSGSGTLVKTGEATLSVKDISDVTGTISVEDGVFAITGRPPLAEPVLVEDGRIAHFDMASGVSLVTNTDASVSLASWNSRLNDGWTAVPGSSYGKSGTTFNPVVLRYELNGLPIVRMRYLGWNDGEEYLLFRKDGVQTMMEGIRSVFWVIGSQEGGGFVLGGGVNPYDSSYYPWHRGGNIDNPADSIVRNLAQSEVQAAAWRRGGTNVASSAGLSGGYEVLSMVMKTNAVNAATAEGFAFDGRTIHGDSGFRSRSGRQRLGEVIFYNRSLSDEERANVEAYLSTKWGFWQKTATNAATVAVAFGATLNTGDGQYVDSLAGSGTVNGNVTVRHLVRDFAAENVLSVNGTLTLARNPVIELLNVPANIRAGGPVAVASATAVANAENLSGATITGVPPAFLPRAFVRDGMVMVRFAHGMQISFK